MRETIDSALSQTYRQLDVVVVDDASTDGTRKVLDHYAGRIKILDHPDRVNRGQSASINLAMRSTRSDYVAVLDSDDYWAPEKIERQVEYLEGHPEIGLVYVNGLAVNEGGTELYRLFPVGHVETNNLGRVLLTCHFNIPSNALVRRSVFDLAGEFDETMHSAQDHDMAIRIAEIAKLAYIDEPLWYYRKHQNTQSGRHAKRRWETGFRILNKACRRYPYGLNLRRRRLAVLNFRLGQCLQEEGRFERAMFRYIAAGLLDPWRALRVFAGLERGGGPH